MDKELKILIISALIHNVGDFLKKADLLLLDNDSGEQNKYNNQLTFFINEKLPLPAELENERKKIADICSGVHNPEEKDPAKIIIRIASQLAAGFDNDTYVRPVHIDNFLVSVFDEIELYNHIFNPPGNYFYKLAPLEAASDNIFPVKDPQTNNAASYKLHIEAFFANLKNIKVNTGFEFYLGGLISVLEKFTWCIPSFNQTSAMDISIFDHAMTTATITQAMYLYHKQDENIPAFGDGSKKFILMSGDLSGIQKYIFHINKNSGKGVSKIFRARSFFLQALTRSVILSIQKRLGLSSVCRLIDSGGKFVLLLPCTPEVQNKMEILDGEIQSWFRNKFKGLLTMNISCSVKVTQQDFSIKYFQDKLDEVNEALQIKKLQKLYKTFSKEGTIIDGNYDEREGKNCSLCNINVSDEESSKKYTEGEIIETAICRECYEQINYIGKRLPDTNYLIYANTAQNRDGISLFDSINLELSHDEPANLSSIQHVECLSDSCNFARARLARHLPKLREEELNDKNWSALFSEDEDHNVQSIEVGQPKTFNWIALKSKKVNKDNELIGRPLLGFFKADVDNLGLIFSMGLEKRLSPARLTSLSRMLNIFFSEYIVELASAEYPDIYSVFAGGDDLFMVGPWDQIIHFAVKVREQFRKYCAENPDITLSGGIFISKPRLPMRKAVELAEDYLESAKKYTSDKRQKDSLCILSETVSWQEITKLMELGDKFDRAIDESKRTGFSTAFLYRLLEYHHMYRKFTYGKKIKYGRYLALAHYDIARNILSEDNRDRDELNMLYDIFAVGDHKRSSLEKLNIPLFYAINRNRKQ